MCIIAIFEKAYPTSEQLIDMNSLNQDLGGIAWIDGGYVHWKKGIDAKEMITMIKKGIVKLPLICHFRISSSGGHTKDGFLNHPFLCSAKGINKTEGKSKTLPLVFHNGTWGEWSNHLLKSIQATGDKIPDGKMSDTRAMSYLIAKHGINYSMFFENQKIAIMTPKEIIRFGQWYDLKDENTIVSNTFWQNKNETWGNFSFGDMQLMSQGKKPIMEKYKPKLTHKVNAGVKQNLPDINTKKSKKRLKEIEDKIESHGVEMLRPKEIDFLVEILPQELDNRIHRNTLSDMLNDDSIYVIETYYENQKDIDKTMFDIYGIDIKDEITQNAKHQKDIWGFDKI